MTFSAIFIFEVCKKIDTVGAMKTFRFAGFWIRAVASVLDDVIVTTSSMGLTYFGLGLVFLVLKPAPSFGEAFSGGQIQFVEIVASFFVGIPYYIVFHWKQGTTPGKRLFRIVVRDYETGGPITLRQSMKRYFSQAFSALPLGAGFLMAAIHPKKRALHELMSGTVSLILERKTADEKDPESELKL